MFTVSVETRFWACHQLTLPDGSKEPLHGHNWMVTAEVASEKLDNTGLVMDFHLLKAMIGKAVCQFGNRALEEHDYFQQNNSSAEMVAKYVYETLEPQMPKGVKVLRVRVVEEAGCSGIYEK